MAKLEINVTQPWLIAPDGNVAELTHCLAVMNLALRGIQADFGPKHADDFRRNLQHNFKRRTSNFAIRNGPPFNDSDWFRKDDDVCIFSLAASNGERAGVRCRNQAPPNGNANFAWVQHFNHTEPRTLAALQATLLPKPLIGELSVAKTVLSPAIQ